MAAGRRGYEVQCPYDRLREENSEEIPCNTGRAPGPESAYCGIRKRQSFTAQRPSQFQLDVFLNRPQAGPHKYGLFGRLQREELARITESGIPAGQLRTDAQPWVPKHGAAISGCAAFLPRATAGSDAFGARSVSSTSSRTTLICGGASGRNSGGGSSGISYDQFTAPA